MNHVSWRNWMIFVVVIVFLGLYVFGGFDHMFEFVWGWVTRIFNFFYEKFMELSWI